MRSHGHARGGDRTRIYRIWKNIKSRCTNPNMPAYRWYGGCGIAICPRWLRFENFLEDVGEGKPGLTLDRIDSRKGYEPDNCRWITLDEQQRNRTNNKRYSYGGEEKTAPEWSRDPRCVVKLSTLKYRLRRGVPIEVALTSPAKGA